MNFKRRILWISVVGDTMSFASAWMLSYELRRSLDPYFSRPVNSRDIYLASLPLIVITWLAVAAFMGTYSQARKSSRLEDLKAVMRTTVLAQLAIMSVGFLFKEFDFARAVVLFSGVLTPLLLWISRQVVRKVEQAGIRSGEAVDRVLIVGTGETAVRAVQSLQSKPDSGFEVVGFLYTREPPPSVETIAGAPILGSLERIEQEITRHQVGLVLFAEPSLGHEQVLDLIAGLRDRGVSFSLVTDRFDLLAQHLGAEWIGEFPVVPLDGRRPGLLYEISKRFLDITLGILFLAMSLPLWPLIAIGIKLTSKGPVFILQERVGKGGKHFKMIKFRTMKFKTPLYAPSPEQPQDERITWFGRFLRRMSLDELPQLLNVVLGQMSLVGPRPEMPFIVDGYTEWQKERLEVKPGLTGLWQVLGRKEIPLLKHLEYDFYYIRNRSMSLDLTILLLTPAAIVLGKGAY